MSKIRVYELAKELGLENKALLDLCVQLGMDDKQSHSNSLSDDEAEKIRRFVIRRAVNEKGPSVREVNKEGHLLTESRLGGNVIRRRKKEDAEEEETPPPSRQIDLSSVQASRELPTLAPDLAAERMSREAALRQADALFGPKTTKSEPAPEQTEPAAEEAPQEAEPTEEPAEQAAAPVETEFAEEPEVEAAVEQLVQESEPAQEAEAAPAADDAQGAAHLEAVRKRHDIRAPKVLGKIELPVKPVPVKRTVTVTPKAAAEPGTQEPAEEFEGEGANKRKKKGKVERTDTDGPGGKKVKKKQILSKNDLLDYDGERDGWRTKKTKKKTKGDRDGLNGHGSPEAGPTKQSKKVVRVPGHISVGELAKQMSLKVGEVMGVLMKLGVMAMINTLIDFETATIVASEFGFTTQNTDEDVEDLITNLSEVDTEESLVLRPPVVTVMGHVDHGKTSLLDAIRKTSVTKGEFGGITQHIGAYNVVLPHGGSVTFLDTPGHEAFTAMRSRGAKVTDIVVLVVAADDGVMPQTIEAINHAKAANVPIIVAVNKIDKEGANRDRIINQLAEHGLIPEEWGGTTIVCNVSAHTKEGIDNLLENLHLQAEILELRANPNRRAVGTVVESKIDRGRGPVISVLVSNGTLRKGDVFVAGAVFGKVRALVDDDGKRIDEAGPSIPAEVLGAQGTPLSGDDFIVFESEAQARSIAEQRSQGRRLKELAKGEGAAAMGGALTLEKFSQLVSDSADLKELPLIVKADVQGSVEAVTEALLQLSNEEVKIKVIHKGVGAINENDVQLASASKALLVGFNVRADARAQQLVDAEGLEVLYSRVIYDLVDSVNSAVKGMRAPVLREKTLGRLEVRQTFKVPRQGVVAGSYVLDGVISRGAQVRLLRDSKVIYEGKMASLRRFKDDVREVSAGYECGVGIEGYSDIKNGDIIEVFKVEEVRV
ncbi:MAG: translation initiation factor IF-2 [Bdellovibrionota bacterium]